MNELTTISIKPVPSYTLNWTENDMPIIKEAMCQNGVVVLRTESPCPLISTASSMSFQPFEDNGKLTEVPVCSALSNSAKYLALGYENATISLIDLNKKIILKTCGKQNALAPRFLAFSADEQAIISIDDSNEVDVINISSGVFGISLKEQQILPASEERISNVFIPSSYPKYLIYSTDTSVNYYDTALKQTSSIATCAAEQVIHFSTLIANEHIIISTYHDFKYEAYEVTDKQQIEPVYETFFSDKVIDLANLNYCVIGAITENTVYLVNIYNKTNEACSSADLPDLVKDQLHFAHHEKVYFLQAGKMKQVTFFGWSDRIMNLANEKRYQDAIELAIAIYCGENDRVFGIPRNVRTRVNDIQAFTQPILLQAVGHVNLSRILRYAAQLDLSGFITEILPNLCKANKPPDSPTITEYYIEAFGKSYHYTSKFLKPKHYQRMFDHFDLIGKTKEIEPLMLMQRFPMDVASYLLNLSYNARLKRLVVRLLTEYFDDFISPLVYLYGEPEFLEYVDDLFVKQQILPNAGQRHRRLVALWFFTPINKKFARLYYLISLNWSMAPVYISSFLKCAPIELHNGVTLSQEAMVDALLRTLHKSDYEQILPILDIVFHYCSDEGIAIPRYSVGVAVRWAYTSTSVDVQVREKLVINLHEQYPEIIDFDKDIVLSNQAGFCEIAKRKYLPEGNLTKIVEVMAVTESGSREIIPFLDEYMNDSEAIEKVIKNCSSILILVDPKRATELIANSFPAYHSTIMESSLIPPYIKYLYLKELSTLQSGITFSKDEDYQLFQLTCQFEPDSALQMLKKSRTLQLDDAVDVCLQYRVIDAAIHIYTMLGKPEKAVSLLAEELEFELVKVIKSRVKLHLMSIDLVADEKGLEEPYKTILMAYDLLAKVPQGTALDNMWRGIFRAFQLPLYQSSSIQDPETKYSITLFFAFFVVESLARKDPNFILEIVHYDFSHIETKQLRTVFSAVFRYLDYQQMLSSTVQSLLLEDCVVLTKGANLTKKRGAFVYSTNCAMCQQTINGEGGVGMLLFSCGHCFHDNLTCGGHKTCPVCSGNMIQKNGVPSVMGSSKAAILKQRRALARVEFMMKPNYGKLNGDENGNSTFLLSSVESRRNKVTKITLNTPEEEPDEIKYAFLEL